MQFTDLSGNESCQGLIDLKEERECNSNTLLYTEQNSKQTVILSSVVTVTVVTPSYIPSSFSGPDEPHLGLIDYLTYSILLHNAYLLRLYNVRLCVYKRKSKRVWRTEIYHDIHVYQTCNVYVQVCLTWCSIYINKGYLEFYIKTSSYRVIQIRSINGITPVSIVLLCCLPNSLVNVSSADACK